MKKYPDEFKRQALMLAAQPGMNLRPAESDLGITRGLLYKWHQRYGNPRVHAELCAAAWGTRDHTVATPHPNSATLISKRLNNSISRRQFSCPCAETYSR